MAHHLALLDGAPNAEQTPGERLASALGDVIVQHPDNHSMVKNIERIKETVDMIDDTVDRIREGSVSPEGRWWSAIPRDRHFVVHPRRSCGGDGA